LLVNRSAASNAWLECANWLNSLELLSPAIATKLSTNQLQLSEFANLLRDGELLCNLANKLCEDCIDPSLINKRAQMSQLLCLYNIRLFLNACKSAQFLGLSDSDLFDEHMLYDLLDLACVIRTLSIVSMSRVAQSKGVRGFTVAAASKSTLGGVSKSAALVSNNKAEHRLATSITNKLNLNSNNNNSNINSSNEPSDDESSCGVATLAASDPTTDDIYYNIMPAEDKSSPGGGVGGSPVDDQTNYLDFSFLDSSQSTESERVYQKIVTTPASKPGSGQPTIRDFVMKEIFDTEKNFVNGLNTELMNNFLIPLSTVLNEADRKTICINLAELIALHTSLLDKLRAACQGLQGRSQRVCAVFEDFKMGLMREYALYFSTIERSIARCDSLAKVPLSSVSDHNERQYITAYRVKLAACKNASSRQFNLTELLRLPYQRVLKYHLLFTQLYKQTDKDHGARSAIERTCESMHELGNYLNECQRDKENLSKIELVLKHFQDPSASNTNQRSAYAGGLNLILSKDYGRYIKVS
jgi:guanine nucleotide exchange factor VAV